MSEYMGEVRLMKLLVDKELDEKRIPEFEGNMRAWAMVAGIWLLLAGVLITP